jgi:hypothetical protein
MRLGRGEFLGHSVLRISLWNLEEILLNQSHELTVAGLHVT